MMIVPLSAFYALSVRKPTAYVFFLAIDSSKRSRGYGDKALALMKKQYAGYQIVLDMEAIDDEAENIGDVKHVKAFIFAMAIMKQVITWIIMI